MNQPELTTGQKEQVVALCQQHKARRLTWLYEPIRTGPGAGDAAMLIEFAPADMPSLATLAVMEEEVSRILGCQSDLHLYLRELYLGYGPSETGIVYDRADYMDIPLPMDKIAEFCERKNIKRLAKLPFPSRASVIRYADVDFVAELGPDAKLAWGSLEGEEELSAILGCEAAIEFVKEFPPDLEVIYSDAASIQSAPAD